MVNSRALMIDLNYYENKINLMRKGQVAMMHFFNIETQYKRLKLQTIANDKTKGTWEKINNVTVDYDNVTEELKELSESLYKFNQYLA